MSTLHGRPWSECITISIFLCNICFLIWNMKGNTIQTKLWYCWYHLWHHNVWSLVYIKSISTIGYISLQYTANEINTFLKYEINVHNKEENFIFTMKFIALLFTYHNRIIISINRLSALQMEIPRETIWLSLSDLDPGLWLRDMSCFQFRGYKD